MGFAMSKINSPTLDLFIYNYSGIPESAQKEYDKYWDDLDKKLQAVNIISKKSSANYKIYYQPLDKDKQIDISYVRKSIQDTYLLNYSSSQDKAIELSELTNLLNKLKELTVLPQIEKLNPGRLSENGYLGKTWMISTWMDNHNEFTEDIADNIYYQLIKHKHQHLQTGQFLGAKVWEM